ncbi:hypothetical protein ABZ797_35645 [Streptomyces antimycoticus]|uniref:Uncharacterized protein n=1 Tax=Streptomyces antimycoticus TaxID=68175 RepID=A0ABD5JKP2_9ACTN|nr:hypothetical protein [Streptomyces violaceusniger]MEE4588117.1 hypothetical protein [Streptomyces sp. DSM 41602]
MRRRRRRSTAEQAASPAFRAVARMGVLRCAVPAPPALAVRLCSASTPTP